MKITKTLFYGILALMFFGCKKEDVDQKETCQSLPGTDSPFGYDLQEASPLIEGPCFNPNNRDEISFTKVLAAGQSPELWIANLKTGQQQKLVDQVWFQPDWSEQDWFIFNRPGAQIWKIKSNGDSLTQLTSIYENYHPNWGPGGKSYVFRQQKGNTVYVAHNSTKQERIFLSDKLGRSMFQIISPDGTKISGGELIEDKIKYGYYSLPDYLFTPLQEFDKSDVNHTMQGVAWHPNSQQLFWSNGRGLFKANLGTGETTLLKEGCLTKVYTYPSVSPDGSTLAVSITTRTPRAKNSNTLVIESAIWLMDTDGRNERKLTL